MRKVDRVMSQISSGFVVSSAEYDEPVDQCLLIEIPPES